jgi:hypothetical protein
MIINKIVKIYINKEKQNILVASYYTAEKNIKFYTLYINNTLIDFKDLKDFESKQKEYIKKYNLIKIK